MALDEQTLLAFLHTHVSDARDIKALKGPSCSLRVRDMGMHSSDSCSSFLSFLLLCVVQ